MTTDTTEQSLRMPQESGMIRNNFAALSIIAKRFNEGLQELTIAFSAFRNEFIIAESARRALCRRNVAFLKKNGVRRRG